MMVEDNTGPTLSSQFTLGDGHLNKLVQNYVPSPVIE